MGTVVFTNGCFDLFHMGHLYTLEYCKVLAGEDGKVVVGLNSDYSISNIKGPDRPIISALQRYEILEAIRYVDEVYYFHEDTPYELIRRIKPDVIVKGPDYAGRKLEVVGADLAEVIIVPGDYQPDISTSQIIEKIKNL